ncbi:unnamed protein product, partial [Closterium sp. NIES-53]
MCAHATMSSIPLHPSVPLHASLSFSLSPILTPNPVPPLSPGVCPLGKQGAVRVMAKDLIRTRHQITKFYGLKSQLQGVSLRIQ